MHDIPNPSRRRFLWSGAAGLAAAGTGVLMLRAGAEPTEASGEVGTYGEYLAKQGETVDAPPTSADGSPSQWAATEPNILGPFYREGAPYRGKLTPPLEPGDVLLIRGRVWGLDTRKPLTGVTLDLWQANRDGRYDNDDPRRPPAPDVFTNRTRLLTDEHGRYEVETIHPGAYRIGARQWRPPHVHYLVRAAGYKTLVTQLYFKGDPHQNDDVFIRPSLIIDLAARDRDGRTYHEGVFDIVLAKA